MRIGIRRRLVNPSPLRRLGGLLGLPSKRRKRKNPRRRRRVSNVGEIITIGLNPGRKNKGMAVRRRKKYSARRRNPRKGTRKVMFFARRRNPFARRIRRRRRNPSLASLTSGKTGAIVGVLGGATVTSQLARLLPPQWNSGLVGYLSNLVVAYAQGYLVGRMLGNKEFGESMALGGYTYVALRVINDIVPATFATILPIGLRGITAPMSWYTPQALGSKFNTYQLPPAIAGAVGGAGVGRVARVK